MFGYASRLSAQSDKFSRVTVSIALGDDARDVHRLCGVVGSPCNIDCNRCEQNTPRKAAYRPTPVALAKVVKHLHCLLVGPKLTSLSAEPSRRNATAHNDQTLPLLAIKDRTSLAVIETVHVSVQAFKEVDPAININRPVTSSAPSLPSTPPRGRSTRDACPKRFLLTVASYWNRQFQVIELFTSPA